MRLGNLLDSCGSSSALKMTLHELTQNPPNHSKGCRSVIAADKVPSSK